MLRPNFCAEYLTVEEGFLGGNNNCNILFKYTWDLKKKAYLYLVITNIFEFCFLLSFPSLRTVFPPSSLGACTMSPFTFNYCCSCFM